VSLTASRLARSYRSAAPETWRHCRASEPHEAVPIDGTQYTQPGTGATEAACANCGDGEAVVLQGLAAQQ
jgi:hypothetical protein